jgi:hypothetical protein
VRYEAANAMSLNEFLKEHCKVEEQVAKGQEQDASIAQLKSADAKQEATIDRAHLEGSVKTRTGGKISLTMELLKEKRRLESDLPFCSSLRCDRGAVRQTVTAR